MIQPVFKNIEDGFVPWGEFAIPYNDHLKGRALVHPDSDRAYLQLMRRRSNEVIEEREVSLRYVKWRVPEGSTDDKIADISYTCRIESLLRCLYMQMV